MVDLRTRAIASALVLLAACTSKEASSSTCKPHKLATVRIDSGFIQSLVTWDHYMAWARAFKGNVANAIQLFDAETGETKVIATPTQKAGDIQNLDADGDYIVYREFAFQPRDESDTPPWTIYVLNFKTGRRRVVARRTVRAGPEAGIPYPQISGRWITWFDDGVGLHHAVLVAHDIQTGKKHTVVPGNVSPYSQEIDGEDVVYEDHKGESIFDHSALHAIRVDGTDPKTFPAKDLDGFEVGSGWLAWQEKLPNSLEATSWVTRIRGNQAPRKVANEDGSVYPGKDFVLVRGPDNFSCVSLTSDTRTELADPNTLVNEQSVDGHQVAYATFPDDVQRNLPITIHLVRL